MASQHTHFSTPFVPKKFTITVLCDGLQSPANVGALFRICDAFGVEKIIFGNAAFSIHSRRLQKTARGTHTTTPYAFVDTIASELAVLKENGYTCMGLEITENSIPLRQFSVKTPQKIALILGNEQEGISEDLLALTDQVVHIEMFGANSSMNVVQAAAIALYTFTNV